MNRCGALLRTSLPERGWVLLHQIIRHASYERQAFCVKRRIIILQQYDINGTPWYHNPNHCHTVDARACAAPLAMDADALLELLRWRIPRKERAVPTAADEGPRHTRYRDVLPQPVPCMDSRYSHSNQKQKPHARLSASEINFPLFFSQAFSLQAVVERQERTTTPRIVQ